MIFIIFSRLLIGKLRLTHVKNTVQSHSRIWALNLISGLKNHKTNILNPLPLFCWGFCFVLFCFCLRVSSLGLLYCVLLILFHTLLMLLLFWCLVLSIFTFSTVCVYFLLTLNVSSFSVTGLTFLAFSSLSFACYFLLYRPCNCEKVKPVVLIFSLWKNMSCLSQSMRSLHHGVKTEGLCLQLIT